MPHLTPIRVRYAECDPMGVAHHSAYPVWLEIGRTELLRSHGIAYRDLETQGIFLAVVHLEIKYRSPARYDDELTLHTKLDEALGSRVKIRHHYELFRDTTLLAAATTTLACLDHQGRPQPLPPLLLHPQ